MNNGLENTIAMHAVEHFAAHYTVNLTSVIANWYFLSRDRPELCYRYLKPEPTKNVTYAAKYYAGDVELENGEN